MSCRRRPCESRAARPTSPDNPPASTSSSEGRARRCRCDRRRRLPPKTLGAVPAGPPPAVRLRRSPLLTGPAERGPRVDLSKGKGVRHPLLGPGVVLEVEGEGENAKLMVFFDKAGKRRLIVKYAGLEPL